MDNFEGSIFSKEEILLIKKAIKIISSNKYISEFEDICDEANIVSDDAFYHHEIVKSWAKVLGEVIGCEIELNSPIHDVLFSISDLTEKHCNNRVKKYFDDRGQKNLSYEDYKDYCKI